MAKKRSEKRPTPKMIREYHQLQQRWGEPDDLIVFDAALPQPLHVPLIHVPIWGANEECDVTTFNTLGMSEQRMVGAKDFTELHLAVRDKLDGDQRLALARMLANVVEYPFQYGLKLDWWEIIPNAGQIPVFSGCRHLLLHPKLTDEGTEVLDDDEGPIRLLYVVPITPRERHLLVQHDRDTFLTYLEEDDVDLLADRQDEPQWYKNE